jgi:hypothetical protein
MGFFDFIFGKTYTEEDNLGTRHETLSFASSYWLARQGSPNKEPFVLFQFDEDQPAETALLELPIIERARDTGKLICTEVLIFGYYPQENGKVEAILCGGELSYDLWQQAKVSFEKHGGTLRNELAPSAEAKPAKKTGGNAGRVEFLREERPQRYGTTMTYRIHKAPSKAAAMAFLEKNPVTQKLYYLVVETPEGTFSRDLQGIYKE